MYLLTNEHKHQHNGAVQSTKYKHQTDFLSSCLVSVSLFTVLDYSNSFILTLKQIVCHVIGGYRAPCVYLETLTALEWYKLLTYTIYHPPFPIPHSPLSPSPFPIENPDSPLDPHSIFLYEFVIKLVCPIKLLNIKSPHPAI